MMRVERTMAERVMREDEAPERMEDDMGRENETPGRVVANRLGRWVVRRLGRWVVRKVGRWVERR